VNRVFGATVALVFAVAVAAPGAAWAQLGAAPAPRVQLPPELCRIWYRGVPVERQPPPMDCRAARRQAAISGGLVIAARSETGGALRIGDWDERYRRDTEIRDAREQARSRRDRDRDWRDGTWNDRDWRDDIEPW
jgi:hypothetical protein